MYMPWAVHQVHDRQAVLPAVEAYIPPGQDRHRLAVAAYVPAGQGVQAVDPVAEIDPAGQVVQPVSWGVAWKYPALQAQLHGPGDWRVPSPPLVV